MKEIINDVEILVDFANKHFTNDAAVDKAADRVQQYISTYKLDDIHGE